MFTWINLLFDTRGFPPRFECGQAWTPFHGWTHIVSDALIFGAYMAIPIALAICIVGRKEKTEINAVGWLFCLFIVCCGTGHIIESVIFFKPIYRLSALMKVVTAAVSWATVFALAPMIPKLLSLPGLETLNQRLRAENQERRQIERSLKRIVEIVNQSNDAILSLDPMGHILSWNNGAQALYGYRADEVVGHSVSLIMADPETELAALKNSIVKDQAPAPFETKRQTKDGRWVPVSVSKSFIRDPNGTITSVSVIDRDLSQQKQVEFKFEKVVESSPNGLVMVDAEGKIVLANAQCTELFGYPHEELMGESVDMLVPEARRTQHALVRRDYMREPITRAMAMSHQAELFGCRKDGRQFPIEVGLTPMSIDDETFVLATVIDVTSRKQFETEIVEAKNKAEAATAAKSRFLANMSHEIRTPLNAIMALASMPLEDDVPLALQKNIRTIRRSGDVLLNIINNILDFSKIEAGEITLDTYDFRLTQVVEEAFQLVTPNVHNSGVELATVWESDVKGRYRGDVTKLRQILLNLLSNAAKFTESGSIVLSVGVVDEASDGQGAAAESMQMLRFVLKDTGPGIAEDNINDILKPFKRAENATMEVKGTGLGLSICVNFIELMGGHISIKNAPSQTGTVVTFSVRLQVLENSSPEDEYKVQLLDKNVLIYDQFEPNRAILRRQALGWQALPVVAESAEEALKWIERPLDMVLIDGRLLLSSEGLFAGLRQRMRESEVNVVVIGEGLELKNKFSSSRVRYIKRPIYRSELDEAVLSLVLNLDIHSQTDAENQAIIKLGEHVPLRILVAEDNPTNRQVLRLLLKRLGYSATFAKDGLEATAVVKANDFDLIFMDIQMPHCDGVEATQAIRDHVNNEDRPWIIALTANVFGRMRSNYLSSGMNDFLAKPIRIVDLYKTLLRCPLIPDSLPESAAQEQAETNRVTEQNEIIDWSQIRTLIEVGELTPEDIDTLLVSFRDSSRLDMERIHKALEDNDPALFYRGVHALLGSCTTFGAVALGDCLRDMHDLDKAASYLTSNHVQRIDKCYNSFIERIFEWQLYVLQDKSPSEIT